MKYALVVICLSLLLGACGLDDAVDRMNQSTDRNRCGQFGFVPGTTAFANCMMQQATQRQDEDQQIQNRMQLDDAVQNLKKK